MQILKGCEIATCKSFRIAQEGAGPYSNRIFHRICAATFKSRRGVFTPQDVAIVDMLCQAHLAGRNLQREPPTAGEYADCLALAESNIGHHLSPTPLGEHGSCSMTIERRALHVPSQTGYVSSSPINVPCLAFHHIAPHAARNREAPDAAAAPVSTGSEEDSAAASGEDDSDEDEVDADDGVGANDPDDDDAAATDDDGDDSNASDGVSETCAKQSNVKSADTVAAVAATPSASKPAAMSQGANPAHMMVCLFLCLSLSLSLTQSLHISISTSCGHAPDSSWRRVLLKGAQVPCMAPPSPLPLA